MTEAMRAQAIAGINPAKETPMSLARETSIGPSSPAAPPSRQHQAVVQPHVSRAEALRAVGRHGSETSATAEQNDGDASQRRRGGVNSAEPAKRDGLDREHRGEGPLAADAVGYPAPEEAPDGIEDAHDPE